MNLLILLACQLSLCLANSAPDPSIPTNLQPPPIDYAVDNGTYGYYPTDSYFTEEALNGPKTNFLQWHDRCDDGLLYFITPRGWGIQNPGPMLLDARGNMVWARHFDNKYGGQAYDMKLQQYRGQHVMTFWLGDDRVRGHGSGFYYMLNTSYDVVHRVGAANGLSADLHEFLITSQGTALMTMYEIVEFDLANIPGYEVNEDAGPSYIWDCVFQEVDIESGGLVYEWRASDHVNVTTTYHGIGPGGSKDDPFDWFHMNSVDKDDLGNYLISARYTHSISYIDGNTGDIIWTLGGRLNSFMDLSGGDAINFAWQHDARFVPADTFPNMYTPPAVRDGFTTRLISLFDNAAEDQHYEYGLPFSRALLLEVTYPTTKSAVLMTHPDLGFMDMDLNQQKVANINGTDPENTVRVIKSYENPLRVRSSSQGSMQILSQTPGQDPKVLVGYGLNAVWTEFDSDGTVLCDAHYGSTTSWERGDIQSYRIFKFPWVGLPEKPPVVEISDDEVEIYVSWNGATEVAHWILQCSDSNTDNDKFWEDVVKVPKVNFETTMLVPDAIGTSRYLRIIAVDRTGHRLVHGTTAIIDRGFIATYLPGLSSKLPPEVSHTPSLKIFGILVFVVCTAMMLFGLSRRYLSWRKGKWHAGPLRLRRGSGYHLLGDVYT